MSPLGKSAQFLKFIKKHLVIRETGCIFAAINRFTALRPPPILCHNPFLMKSLRFSLFSFLCVGAMTVCFTACDENMTIDVPGPDLEFQFDYTDLRSAQGQYILVAESDTVFGKDMKAFLSGEGQDYDSIVASATIKDAYLSLTPGYTFAGVDSLQIRYRIAGTQTEMVLAVAGATPTTVDTMWFSDVKVSKEAIFEFISTDVIASLYAIYNPFDANFNCFQPGVSYTFRAKTTVAVKLAAALGGGMSF